MGVFKGDEDLASDFLYWNPLGGGMPDSSIWIGVDFEVGGAYEDWGFVIKRTHQQGEDIIATARTLKEAIEKARTKYPTKQNNSKALTTDKEDDDE